MTSIPPYDSDKHSLKNIIVKDIFSDQEIADIYSHIEKTPEDKLFIQEVYGHAAHFTWLPENVVNTIIAKANENHDKRLVLRELSFARYSTQYGTPLLFPHFDQFPESRITFDIQVKASKPWALVVEDRPYTLQDNEALIFSGTHQIHWREKSEFSDDDYVDMIFCHFSEEDATPMPDSHIDYMKSIEQQYRDKWYSV